MKLGQWLSLRFGAIVLVLALLVLIASAASAMGVQVGDSPPVVPPFVLTSEILAAVSGVVISLAFSYVPGLNRKFAYLAEEHKQLLMAGMLLVVAAAVFGLGCAGILTIGIACTQGGSYQLIWIWIVAIMANQGIHRLSPKTGTVKDAMVTGEEDRFVKMSTSNSYDPKI